MLMKLKLLNDFTETVTLVQMASVKVTYELISSFTVIQLIKRVWCPFNSLLAHFYAIEYDHLTIVLSR